MPCSDPIEGAGRLPPTGRVTCVIWTLRIEMLAIPLFILGILLLCRRAGGRCLRRIHSIIDPASDACRGAFCTSRKTSRKAFRNKVPQDEDRASTSCRAPNRRTYNPKPQRRKPVRPSNAGRAFPACQGATRLASAAAAPAAWRCWRRCAGPAPLARRSYLREATGALCRRPPAQS